VSKAFTRESDDAPEAAREIRPLSALPPGAMNRVTPAGARRLREELAALLAQRAARAAASASTPDPQCERRIAQLRHTLATAVVTPPPPPPWERVQFGATVTVRDPNGECTRYHIVGVDEADADRNRVSWQSPIARALLNARLGDTVRFKFPDGETRLEIAAVTYE
jgi:transcription elongation factor GreB